MSVSIVADEPIGHLPKHLYPFGYTQHRIAVLCILSTYLWYILSILHTFGHLVIIKTPTMLKSHGYEHLCQVASVAQLSYYTINIIIQNVSFCSRLKPHQCSNALTSAKTSTQWRAQCNWQLLKKQKYQLFNFFNLRGCIRDKHQMHGWWERSGVLREKPISHVCETDGTWQ